MCIRDSSADKGVDLDKIHVVPVGVDPDLFLPVPGVERRPGHIVTTASADVAMKGLKFLLEAVAKLRTERHMELTIIGKRRPDSHASQTMTALGLDDCVNFVSGVPDERIVELYSEAELACVPSLYEGFSLPAIEAMSCGAWEECSFNVGDRVRVVSDAVVYHHPKHKAGLAVRGLVGSVSGLASVARDGSGAALSANRPVVVQFEEPRLTAHFEEGELELDM